MPFWEKVEQLRKEQNTSYRWLAQMMGVSETTVSSMRKAGTEPRASEAAKIASALGTTVEFLVKEEATDSYFLKYTQLKKELAKLIEVFSLFI